MNRISKLAIAAMAVLCVGSLAKPADARNGFNPSIQAVIQNNFAVRQQQLRLQIGADVSAGRLSPGMAANLISQLDQINAEERQFLSTQGMISDAQNSLIIGQFTSVTQQLDSAAVVPAYLLAAAPSWAAPVPTCAPRFDRDRFGRDRCDRDRFDRDRSDRDRLDWRGRPAF